MWQQQQPEVLAPVIGDGLLGGNKRCQSLRDILTAFFFILRLRLLIYHYHLSSAAPGMKTLIPAAAGVVISQTAQVYQPVIISQPAIQVDRVLTWHLCTANTTTHLLCITLVLYGGCNSNVFPLTLSHISW